VWGEGVGARGSYFLFSIPSTLMPVGAWGGPQTLRKGRQTRPEEKHGEGAHERAPSRSEALGLWEAKKIPQWLEDHRSHPGRKDRLKRDEAPIEGSPRTRFACRTVGPPLVGTSSS